MDSNPLVNEQIEAGARFVEEFNKYAPVAAAFWLKEMELSCWNLYVASERIADTDVKAAQHEVWRIIDPMRSPYFDSFSVRIIPMTDRLTRAALDYYRLYPNYSGPIRLGEMYFGDRAVDGVYLYPLPKPTAVA